MGWSIHLYWPGATAQQGAGHPGFFNDDHGWASFMVAVDEDDAAAELLIELGYDVLGAAVFEEMDDEGRTEALVPPAEFAAAALSFGALVAGADERVAPLVALYAKEAVDGVDGAAEELARDCRDLAAIAKYASDQGAEAMALEYTF